MDEWKDHYDGFVPGYVCGQIEGASAATHTLLNWSGVVAYSGNYDAAVGTTHFFTTSSCSTTPNSFANWVGLGGYSSNRLLQNGFMTYEGGGRHPFFEAIDDTDDTTALKLNIDAIVAGDEVRLKTSFSDGTAHFTWHDFTSGDVVTLSESNFIGIDTQNVFTASEAYDKSSAEAVDERAIILQHFSELRNFGSDPWTDVHVYPHGSTSSVLIRDETHHNFEIVDNAGTHLTTWSGGASSGDFTDTWEHCGTVD